MNFGTEIVWPLEYWSLAYSTYSLKTKTVRDEKGYESLYEKVENNK